MMWWQGEIGKPWTWNCGTKEYTFAEDIPIKTMKNLQGMGDMCVCVCVKEAELFSARTNIFGVTLLTYCAYLHGCDMNTCLQPQ